VFRDAVSRDTVFGDVGFATRWLWHAFSMARKGAYKDAVVNDRHLC